MQGVKFNPTPEQIQYLIDNFANTKNADLSAHLNISIRSVNRLASQLGLSKSEEFLIQVRRESVEPLRLWHRLHPKPSGYRIPNSEQTLFRRGDTYKHRYGEEAHRLAHQKSVVSRNETIKKERRRILFGLPQQTNLNLHRQPRKKVLFRYYLRKRGYIIDDDKRMAYYTDSTQRGERVERRQQQWYTFAPLPDNNN